MLKRPDEPALFGLAQGAGTPEEQRLAQETLLQQYERLALALSRRFYDRGEPEEDLDQVARLGLLNAIARYEPERGTRFATYAAQTIVGEIKRYFRDKSWGLRVPRYLQEINLAARRAAESLTMSLGRSPTIGEIAASVGQPPEVTLEALELGRAHDLMSLDESVSAEDEVGTPVGEMLGASGTLADFRDALEARVLVDSLPPRMRTIVLLRHLHGLSQAQIAERLGISQMHVSRLYRRALATLHAELQDGGEDAQRG